MNPSRTFFWDFFGPNSMQTARHFQRHLEQFLEQNAIVGCEVGTKSEHPGHFAAFCCAPEAVQNALIQALRPQRAL